MKMLRTSWLRRLGHYKQYCSTTKNYPCGIYRYRDISRSKNTKWFSITKNKIEDYYIKESYFKNIW